MGDKRKLQAEIDRCLKKVAEGVEAFEDIWKKVHSSNNTNQKEKFEADLKKEIKKLQRLRDQIKSWLVCGDIKDKQILTENRKLIEQQMERFKVIERETKTKAYSKEGLVSTGKVDPKEKEKDEITNWLSNCIDSLNVQVDKLESEVEAMMTRKKKLDRDEQARHETCKDLLSRHRYHIDKLETILRMVDNGALQFELIKKIHEDVEYYIDSNQEADFEENDFIYDELDLDDIATAQRTDIIASSPSEGDVDATGLGTGPSSNHSGSPSPSSGAITHSKPKTEEENKKRHLKMEDLVPSQTKNNLTVKTNLTEVPSNASTIRLPQTPTKSNNLGSVPSTPTSANVSRPTLAASQPGLGYAQVAGSHHNSTSGKPVPTVVKPHQGGTNGLIVMPQMLLQSIIQTSTATGHSNSTSSSCSTPTTTSTAAAATVSSLNSDLPSSSLPISSAATVMTSTAPSPTPLTGSTDSSLPSQLPQTSSGFSHQPTKPQQTQQLGDVDGKRLVNGTPTHILQSDLSSSSSSSSSSTLKSLSQNVLEQQQRMASLDSSSSTSTLSQPLLELDLSTSLQVTSMTLPTSSDSLQQQPQQQQQLQPASQPVTHTIHLYPLCGVTPLGPQPLTQEQVVQQKMLDYAYRHLPLHCDSESVRVYLPNNPCPTPSYYPHVMPPVMQSPDFFNKLDADSLFFIFYFMEGTKAQYLAARALKQKSWRFHMRYMMWFQRHEEPKTITDEYEQGTYIYFDYEKWAQRKKEGFKFEYKFLEDNDL